MNAPMHEMDEFESRGRVWAMYFLKEKKHQFTKRQQRTISERIVNLVDPWKKAVLKNMMVLFLPSFLGVVYLEPIWQSRHCAVFATPPLLVVVAAARLERVEV